MAFLKKQGLECISSVTNFFMFDTKRDATVVRQGLPDQGVLIGRVWPVWANHCRVSVGTQKEMNAFHEALAKVRSVE